MATAMASVATATRAPRFGSAADLAAYAGLSTKTIRRLVDAGRVRGRKVGRRLLIAFEDLDAHILESERRRSPSMPPPPRPAFDARGRSLRLPADEERRRGAEALRALDALDAMGDEAEQRATFAALAAGLDEHRTSGRSRFG